MRKGPHFVTMAAVLVLGTSVAPAQGIKTGDNVQVGSTGRTEKGA
jgi:hypothetical protein